MKNNSIIYRTIENHEILCLFIMFFVVYNLNGRLIGSGDTIPASLLPFSILENRNIYLDNFYIYFVDSHHIIYFIYLLKGHYLSAYPIVTPVLITPLYIIPYLLLKLSYYPIDLSNPGFKLIVSILEKFSAAFIAALSGIFVFVSLKELVNKKTAFIGVMIFAFATNTWTISSQGLWQQGLVELMLAISIYLVLINEKRNSNKNIIYLGILSGLFIFNRPVDIILLLPVLYYILNLRDRRIAYYFVSMLLFGVPFLFYNFYYFGNLFGGYINALSEFSSNPKNIISFIGLLVSPNRGLFIYSPILILSFFGYLKSLRIANKNVRFFLLILGFSVLIQILIYSCFRTWWAGWSYGPRFLTGALPALAIFLGLQLEYYVNLEILDKKEALKLGFIAMLLIWSIFVQFVGAFYYPNGGWDSKIDLDSHPERLWDWKDTQIGRSFNAGIIPPHNPLEDLNLIVDWRKGIALRAQNGQYVRAEGGGGRELVANRDAIGPWETFCLKDLGNNTVALRAQNGQYVCAEGGGGRELVANRDVIGPWETFELICK